MKCDKCHHEWETVDKDEPCDWCGSSGTVLEEKTALERLVEVVVGRKDS
jgi:hypothetical protein